MNTLFYKFLFLGYMEFNPFKRKISDLNKSSARNGKILISEPFMGDPTFSRSVVYLVDTNEEGAIGFILNKPTNLQLQDVMQKFPSFDAPLFEGGPVNVQHLFFIHNQGLLIEDSLHIDDTLYWSSNFDRLMELIQLGKLQTTDFKFFSGYAGWDAQQLKDELASNSWLIQDATADIVLSRSENLWKEVVRSADKEISIMANFPIDPNLN